MFSYKLLLFLTFALKEVIQKDQKHEKNELQHSQRRLLPCSSRVISTVINTNSIMTKHEQY